MACASSYAKFLLACYRVVVNLFVGMATMHEYNGECFYTQICLLAIGDGLNVHQFCCFYTIGLECATALNIITRYQNI